LSALNEERRGIEQRMQQEAIGAADRVRLTGAGDEALGVCIFDETWHQGVVGLVAARVKDRLHRPVVAFARAEDGSLRGSARSIPGVNIRDAFDSIAVRYPGMIDKFGGHAMAAGLTLKGAQLAAFREAFAAEIAQRADQESLTGVILSDGELQGGELSLATACALRDAGPWGQGFPEPLFDGLFEILDTRIVGEKHLKLSVRSAGRPEALDAIAFGYVGGPHEDAALGRGARVQLAYRLEVNAYRGVERVQLNCRHLKVA
jgi:single-stranded-DNA-specific exonuclease